MREAAGTDALAALGGLWRGMRATGLSAVIAGATLAGLPPAPGFTSLYLLLQALFGAHRIGGVGLQFTLACAVAATGAAAGLGALASMRLIGLAFLGRTRGREGADPRGDRRIADPRGDARIVMAVLAGVGVLLAVAPGLPLLLARGALTGADLPAGPAMLMPSLAALLLAAGCAVSWAVLRAAPGARRVPAWEGGASGGSDMAPYLPGLLASFRWRPRLRPPSLREWLAGAALVLLVVLIVLAAR